MAEKPEIDREGADARQGTLVTASDVNAWFVREVLPLESALMQFLQHNWPPPPSVTGDRAIPNASTSTAILLPTLQYLKIYRSGNGHVRDFTNDYVKYPPSSRLVDVNAKQSESHIFLDLQAGKDLGIGLFGRNGSSILDVGVRFA